jgi:protein tyrosine/serine phosphatase
MRVRIGTVWLAALAIFLGGDVCLAGGTNDFKTRLADWAAPIKEPGLSNFYEVTTNLYRGAQPTVQGMKELKAFGVKTILNLRSFHSDNDLVAHGDFKLARLHMKPWHAEDEDVVTFLKVVTDTNNLHLPVFVHCQRGADRTGMVCAIYRVVVCGWTKEAAIKEMKEGGFNFNPGWKNLVSYIEQVDVEALKKRAGITSK